MSSVFLLTQWNVKQFYFKQFILASVHSLNEKKQSYFKQFKFNVIAQFSLQPLAEEIKKILAYDLPKETFTDIMLLEKSRK